METINYIQHVIDYIETHIKEDLSVDRIADDVGFSKYYLHRLFMVYTGHSLMEYCRKRKMMYAAIDLESKKRIIDIAFDYGYSSERSFSRAIIREFGQSPSQLRKSPPVFTHKYTVYPLLTTLKEGNKMNDYISNVKYETIEEMMVVSGSKIGSEPEDDIIGLMNAFRAENHLDEKRAFGFDQPVSEVESEKGFRGYTYWLVISKEKAASLLPDGQITYKDTPLTIKEVPAYRYASLRITDPFADPMTRIPNGWKTLIAWLEENEVMDRTQGFEKTVECLEEVIEIDGTTYMDIYVPINRL